MKHSTETHTNTPGWWTQSQLTYMR